MPLDLAAYERKARETVKIFWGNRAAAAAKQRELGREDQGERTGITAGKLTQERLYTSATIMTSPRTAAGSGEFSELSKLTSLKTFITGFAGHIAAEAARSAS